MTPAAALAPGAITEVAGIAVGHAVLAGRASGSTVVLCPEGAVGGVDVRGGAPGTRETDLLAPVNLVDRVHAVLLTGGSAFGLDAAGGVMRWLDERGHGLAVGPARVPIVPAAVIFDLWHGDLRLRPDAACGYAACDAANAGPPAQGSVGAGAGATVGKLYGPARAMKGGVGTASLRLDTVTVGAIVVVNAIGDVIDADGRPLAGARSEDGRTLVGTSREFVAGRVPAPLRPPQATGSATTIGVVATDAALDKAQAGKLAVLAHAGLARSVDPLTMYDGDTFFALATGRSAERVELTALGILAAEVVARAIRNAVRAATAVDGLPLPAAHELGTS